jgi:DNA-binding XRE family transcriptional regulator
MLACLMGRGAVRVAKRPRQKPFAARFPIRESRALETLAANMRELRKGLELSQTALAELIEVNQTEVSKLENGRGNPTIILAERLADALGVSLADLFTPEARARSTRIR